MFTALDFPVVLDGQFTGICIIVLRDKYRRQILKRDKGMGLL
jgi:hypothetical protein